MALKVVRELPGNYRVGALTVLRVKRGVWIVVGAGPKDQEFATYRDARDAALLYQGQ